MPKAIFSTDFCVTYRKALFWPETNSNFVVLLGHFQSCPVMFSHVRSCSVIFGHVQSSSVMPSYARSWPYMSGHVWSCPVMSGHVPSCPVECMYTVYIYPIRMLQNNRYLVDHALMSSLGRVVDGAEGFQCRGSEFESRQDTTCCLITVAI
jgi:hypothetical protein